MDDFRDRLGTQTDSEGQKFSKLNFESLLGGEADCAVLTEKPDHLVLEVETSFPTVAA